MDDVVLVTADSVRYDYVDSMEFLASFAPKMGITTGHYTRPSLAGLLSSALSASLQSRVVHPSLAEVLEDAGYTCIGLAPSPQADPTFDFDAGFEQYKNFTEGAGNPVKNRRSPIREFFGQFDLVRGIYRRLFPMEAVLDDLPSDSTVIDEAIDRFNTAPSPRFLWIHLMGTHRPYGVGDDALPKSLDRKAESLGSGSVFDPGDLSDTEQERIERSYHEALVRTDREINRLFEELDGDPVFLFTSDHGEELGEEGYYYHQGYRRRVADTLLQVPVVTRGIEIPVEQLSLFDVAPTVVESLGIESPDSWHGRNVQATTPTDAITIAPWHDETTVVWQDFDTKLVCKDADVSIIRGDDRIKSSRAEVSDELEQRLKNLGYVDVG